MRTRSYQQTISRTDLSAPAGQGVLHRELLKPLSVARRSGDYQRIVLDLIGTESELRALGCYESDGAGWILDSELVDPDDVRIEIAE